MLPLEGSFHDYQLQHIRIPGLRPEIIEAEGTERLQLINKDGVKWEIRTITDSTISLYHRGKQGPMHYQNCSAPAHAQGVQQLLRYVRHHEEYERTGISGRIRRKR